MHTIFSKQEFDRRARIWWASIRPFSLGTSILPVFFALALTHHMGFPIKWGIFFLTISGGLLIHIVTNLTNSLYDWTTGHDSPNSPQVIPVLSAAVNGEKYVRQTLVILFGVLMVLCILFAYFTSWIMIIYPIIGYLGGVYYTKPPIAYKHRGLSLPSVFVLMGILLPAVTFFTQTSYLNWQVIILFLPIAFLVTAILAANELRDCTEDAAAGSSTLTVLFGERFGNSLYHALIILPYFCIALAVWSGLLPHAALLVFTTIPICLTLYKKTQSDKLRTLDMETAYLHGFFCVLYSLSILIST